MQARLLMTPVVRALSKLPADATAFAGGKGACLGKMALAGLPVPPGFVVSTAAFQMFLEHAAPREMLAGLAQRLDVDDSASLAEGSERMRGLIEASAMPPEVEDAIRDGYAALGPETPVAVRSSAVGEDSEAASFAGQQETFLNVAGADAVIRRVKECWASFFSPRALFYRAKKGALAETRIAVVVQEMAFGDKSGVMFTIDPVQKRSDRMVIEAVFGLGEGVVSGLITPNQYTIDREDAYVLDEFVCPQRVAIVRDAHGGAKQIELTEEEAQRRVLNESELGGLREMGLKLEELFGGPQDVEWCIRGEELLLLQSRPVTTLRNLG